MTSGTARHRRHGRLGDIKPGEHRQPYPSEFQPAAGIDQRMNVNFPIAASNAGRIAFSLLGANTLLDLELSALQQEGRGEVVSNPRVITANRKEAVIEQGTEIPYQQASSSGATNISFKKAVLSPARHAADHPGRPHHPRPQGHQGQCRSDLCRHTQHRHQGN